MAADLGLDLFEGIAKAAAIGPPASSSSGEPPMQLRLKIHENWPKGTAWTIQKWSHFVPKLFENVPRRPDSVAFRQFSRA